MVAEIYLRDRAAVERLNAIACEQIFDLSVSCKDAIVDAKSLLALFSFIGKKAFLVAPDEIKPKYFEKMIKQMRLD